MVLERLPPDRQPFLDDKLGLPQGQGITFERGEPQARSRRRWL
jgi:hypothetical protein